MYQAIIYMINGSILTRVFDSYPTDEMICSFLKWNEIGSYEVHY